MHPLLTNMMADAHAAELHEHAGHGHRVPATVRTRVSGHGVAAAVRGYLGHAFAADEQPLRRAGRGAR